MSDKLAYRDVPFMLLSKRSTLPRLPHAFESVRYKWAVRVSRKRAILKRHVALGSVSGIVESDKLSFSIREIEAESHYNRFHSTLQLKEKAHVTRRATPLAAV